MQERLLIRTPADLSVSRIEPDTAARLPRRKRVLLADPAHFRVEYAINPHMMNPDGTIQKVRPDVARRQWESLVETYRSLGLKIEILPTQAGFPDMCFPGHQVFPFNDPIAEHSEGKFCFVPSRMAHDQRAGEVPLYTEWFQSQNYRATPIPDQVKGTFEGGGDLIWYGERRLLIGGVGKRTSFDALRAVSDLVAAPMVVLEMDDPDFFHLDVALTFLDHDTALWVPQAFKANSQKVLRSVVENLVEVDDLEARRGLAANCHSPDGRTVIIHKDNPKTIHMLRNMGYDVVELDVSEFHKSGGSIGSMKMSIW